MKYNLLLLFTMLLSGNISGQSIDKYCGYEMDDSSYKAKVKQASSRSSKNVDLGMTSIPIAFTFLMKSDSTSLYYEGIEQHLMDSISSHFLSAGLHFYIAEDPVFIYDDVVYKFDLGEDNELIYPGIKVMALNVIIAGGVLANGNNLCGVSSSMLPGTVFVDYLCIWSNTLSHEIGHELGLYHTHETVFGIEHVDGSNCNTAGDLICDTPADPNRSDLIDNENDDCEWIGIYEDAFGNDVDLVDGNGDKYNPDLGNIMSYYANKGCTKGFTKMQSQIMNDNVTAQNYGYETKKMKFAIDEGIDMCDNGYFVSTHIINPDPNVEYKWDFDGDGIVDQLGIEAQHLYADYGSYTIKLIMTYPDGNQYYLSKVCVVEHSNESIVAPFIDDFEEQKDRDYVNLIAEQTYYNWRLGLKRAYSGDGVAAAQISSNKNSVMEYKIDISAMEQAVLEFVYESNTSSITGGDSLLVELITCDNESFVLFEKWGIDLGTDEEYVPVRRPLPVVASDQIILRFTSKGDPHFDFNNIYIDSLQVSECYGSVDTLYFNECDSVVYADNVYKTSGIFNKSYTNILGCDSIVKLDITIQESVSIDYTTSICEGESYEGYTQEGEHIDYFVSQNGCDSIRTIYLMVNPIDSSEFSTSICEGESYEGYTQEGIYMDSFTSQYGCDSIRTLDLVILPLDSSELSASICEGESYEGYTQEGIYTDYLVSQNGCDSIRIIELTVLPISESTILDTICEGETLEGYSMSGTYMDTFSSELGCDSIRTLVLEVLPIDHQECNINSSQELPSVDNLIYPNPFNETLNVDERVSEVSIYSIHGKLIQKERLLNSNILNLSHLQAGIYLVRLNFNETIITKTVMVYKL